MKQQLIDFVKQIRWKNVVIYLLLQLLLYHVFYNLNMSFTNGWLFLVLSMTFFGMFGNLQNNLLDYEPDSLKPDFKHFNKTTYLIWAIVFLILGFIFGFTAFYQTFSPTLLYAVLSVPFLLSFYNYILKKWVLAGNLTIAFLTTFAIYIPIAYTKGLQFERTEFYFLLSMAFLLNLMRELVKDMEDMQYDKLHGYYTLPIINFKASLTLLIGLELAFFYILFIYKNQLNNYIFYTLLTTGFLSFILSLKCLIQKNYTDLSRLIKLMMLIGYLSVIFLTD